MVVWLVLLTMDITLICLLPSRGTLKEPNNNSVGVQYRLLLVYTKNGEEGSSYSYIHTQITLLLVYTNTGEEGRSHSRESVH